MIYKYAGINFCGHSNFDICKTNEKEDQEKSVWKKWLRKKHIALTFHLIVTIAA